jgi:dTDP-alpha-D-glucuronic acid decarboxylase
MKCLITGGNGFIATHMARILLEQGHHVTLLDIDPNLAQLAKINLNFGALNYLQVDIVADSRELEEAISQSDWVFHFAALVGVKNYIQSPLRLFDVNVLGSRNIIQACVRHGKRLIFSSTSEIFGKNLNVPWDEDADRVLGSTIRGRWTYSTSKATVEHLIVASGEVDNLDYRIVRFFNSYGPGQNPIFLVSRSIHRAINGLPIETFDGGGQTRCLTYVTDSVNATYEVARRSDLNYRIFNIGAMDELTISEIISLISHVVPGAKVIDREGKDVYGKGYEDLVRRIPSNARIQQETNWRPTTTPQAGIELFVEWAHNNPWWLAKSSDI